MVAPIFSTSVVDVNPHDYLPDAPGLAELLTRFDWRDISELGQPGMRTLSHHGSRPGVIVLSFIDEELVNVVAVRGIFLVQDVTTTADVVPWLLRWEAAL